MGSDEKEIRELRRLLRDLVALATTPAVWVGRDEAQIAEGVADVLLHILRADAVYVRLQSPNKSRRFVVLSILDSAMRSGDCGRNLP